MEKPNNSSTSSSTNKRIFASLLSQTINNAQSLLQEFAESSDATIDLRSTFGSRLETQQFVQSWKVGEFSFPDIEVVNSSQINNANGAFARETNKIYLSKEFLTANVDNFSTINNVFLEEYGHYIDSKLNIIDTPGDEGAIFAAAVRERDLSDRELEQLMGENDTARVILDGKEIQIEQSFTELINGLGGNAGFGENLLPRHDDVIPGSDSSDDDDSDGDSSEEEIQVSTEELSETEETQADDEPKDGEDIEEVILEAGEIDLTSIFGEDGINFYGKSYTTLFVNNNGNVTFNSSLSTFTPSDITSLPIIAPFFADVDTRENNIQASEGGTSTGSNLVYYDVDLTEKKLTVTWDDVGKFPNETTPNAFQLILTDRGSGNFDIEFRYEDIQWTVGGASEDVYARVGYSGGNGADFYELPFSNDQDRLLQLEAGSNGGAPGQFVFRVRDGQPLSEDENNITLLPTATVHRFYEHDRDFYLYSDDNSEIEVIKGRSAAGRQGYEYEYEKEQFRALTSDRDGLTGDIIQGAKPVYRYINNNTDGYLYTMDENEVDYIADNLANYELKVKVKNEVEDEGIEFYAFESPDATELPTIPVYRVLNSQAGTHYLTTSKEEAMALEENSSHFVMENNNEAVFYTFEI